MVSGLALGLRALSSGKGLGHPTRVQVQGSGSGVRIQDPAEERSTGSVLSHNLA